MSDESLRFKTLTEVARSIESREASPVEVTATMLDLVGTHDGRFKSYATVMAEQVVAQAKAAEAEIAAGSYRGPLHGVPIAVKDLCFTRGVRTMGGTRVLADHVPDFDATVVERLDAAGAVLLGKLNTTEGAMGGYHPDRDIPVNPWNADRWAGASSSGSGVATAAGLCFASLGSDTGGSIRFPSAACGIVGVKPTWGRVSRYGVLALAESLDHVGPMTRSTADAGIVLQAISGLDRNDPTTLPAAVPDMLGEIERGVDGVRIGLDQRYVTAGVDPELADAVLAGVRVLEGLGARIVEVRMPPLEEYLEAWTPLCAAEAGGGSQGYLSLPKGRVRPMVSRLARPGRGCDRGRLRQSQQPAGGVHRPTPAGVRGHRRDGLPVDAGATLSDQALVAVRAHGAGRVHAALYRPGRLQRRPDHFGSVRTERRQPAAKPTVHGQTPEGASAVPDRPRLRAGHRLAHPATAGLSQWSSGQSRICCLLSF